MSNGMLKFQEIKSPCGLENFSHMQGYCYHVAGVVGEMLTDLFCDYSVEIAKNRDRLFNLAASFGQGLQMTNILKDLWEDRELGVCWLPKDVFKSVGFDLTHLKPGAYTPSFGNGLEKLIGITNMHLNNALRYTMLIPKHETGIRKFCLWAIGMAILTLRNINRNHQYTSGNDVKISRADVKKVIGVSNVALRSNFLLKMSFRFAARGLPITSPLKPFTGPVVTHPYKDHSKEYQRNAD
jgi:farnesyl-diphosphate farnesyltransferase